MSTEHVCDPTGDPCPPWVHPYPSTEEILTRQNRATAERLRSQPPPAPPRIRTRPVGVVSRLVTQWLRTLADLQRRGYVPDRPATGGTHRDPGPSPGAGGEQ